MSPCCGVAQPFSTSGLSRAQLALPSSRLALRLLQRCLELRQGGFGLGDLMVELGRGDLGQQLALLDRVADIDVAPGDVAGRARVDVGGRKRAGRAGQRHRPSARAGAHRRDANARNEIAVLFRSRHDLRVQREVL